MENSKCKILWDFTVQTNHEIKVKLRIRLKNIGIETQITELQKTVLLHTS